jgi:hypothetical protein
MQDAGSLCDDCRPLREARVPPLLETDCGAFKCSFDLLVVEVLERLQEFAILRVDALITHDVTPGMERDRIGMKARTSRGSKGEARH